MKKLLALLLLTLLTITFVGCDFFSTTTTYQTTESTSQSTIDSTASSTTSNSVVSTTKEPVLQTTTTEGDNTNTTNNTTDVTTDMTTVITTNTTTNSTQVESRYQTIDLYSINDFHGGAYNSIESLIEIAGFMEERRSQNENTIFLSNGDIFQGAALSNFYFGRPIVEAFNEMDMDGFIIGNHEFDWGIDEILKYRDNDLSNGEMEYPILAANIVYKDTQLPLANTTPYIIKELNGVRVGVIGLIGRLENSISASKLENIEFKDPETAAYDYAGILRGEEDCDIVVVYIHNGSYFNGDIAYYSGNHYIDAVFNGHSHSHEMDEYSRGASMPLFYAQANNRDGNSSENSYLAHISLVYDTQEERVVSSGDGSVSEARNYGSNDVFGYSSFAVENIVNDYSNRSEYVNFVYEVLATTDMYLSRYSMKTWGASVLRDYAGVDIGAVNSGGFRVSIEEGDITVEVMMEVYPFDNYIKTCEMTGAEFEQLYHATSGAGYDVHFDDAVYYNSSNDTIYIDGSPLVASQIYVIGAVDYIFDKDEYNFGFLDGSNIQNSGLLMRDILIEDLRNVPDGVYFNPDNGSNYQLLTLVYDPEFYKELKLSLIF